MKRLWQTNLTIRLGNSRGKAMLRSVVIRILFLFAIVSGLPFDLAGATGSEVFALGVDKTEIAPSEVVPQATAEQAADRKGVIWSPHVKWATSSGYNWAGIESDLQDMNRANIGWVRIFIRQDLPFSFLDHLVPLIAQYNVHFLPILIKTDPYHDLGNTTQQAAYRAWVTQIVTRYKSTVRYWEIENETNIPPGWNICCNNDPNKQTEYIQSVKNYVAVLKMAHQAIKTIDPTLQVLIAGICEAGMERFIDELIAQNAMQYFDIISYHPFGPRPEVAKERLDALKVRIAKDPALAAKPIWITAIGFHAMAGWTSPGRTANEEMKADYLLQTLQMIHDTAGVQGAIFWYIFAESSVANGYGLLQFDAKQNPVQKKYLPAYSEYQALWVTKEVAILPASADNFVSENNSTSNFGNSQTLKIGFGSDIRQAYLQFDLTPLAGHTLLKTQFRFATANVAGAGSLGTQVIRMITSQSWTEGGIYYRNQPLSYVGAISNTAQTTGYQTVLDRRAVSRGVGGKVLLTIDSTSADELVIQSREWVKNPPKLVIYYTNATANVASDTEAEANPDGVLSSISEVSLPPIMEEPYPWNIPDPYAGYPLGAPDNSEKGENGGNGTSLGVPLYLPFVSPEQ